MRTVTCRATRGGHEGVWRATTRHSAYRPTMVEDRAVCAVRAIESKWGPPLGGQSRCFGWHSVGSEDGGPLARPSSRVSEPVNLLAPAAPMGGAGCLAPPLARIPWATRRPRALGLGGVLHRRNVCAGEKGGPDVGKTKRGKGSKCMVVVDGAGLPLGISITSASPSEMKLAEPTLETIAVPRRGRGRPRKRMPRLIADRGYDSDPLRRALARRGIDLVCPHRINRVRPRVQDGRKLRRYSRRWIIERTIAWYGAFRRLVVRYERSTRLYLAFFHFASALIALRRL